MLNPAQHLPDMLEVEKFYLTNLEQELAHPIPVPAEANLPAQGGAETMSRWLSLLDLAVTPLMVRDWLGESTSAQTAEALLRYFIYKQPTKEIDRDKTDFVATFVHRRRNVAVRLLDEYTGDEPTPFEPVLAAILQLKDVPALPQEHRQLTREFRFIREELEEIRDFNQLMDSGLMQRSRDVKQRLGASFFHPHVLATAAEYNVCIGDRFDALFKQAAHEIKEFAAKVQKAGGSIMSRIEGDVTIQQLAEVEATRILSADYARSTDQLRTVSKLQKVVDNKTKSLASPTPAAASGSAANASSAPVRTGAGRIPMPSPAEAKGVDRSIEDSKVRSTINSIQNFIAAAQATSGCAFPMRSGSLMLTSAEVDAFRAEYREEKSFRGEYAAAVVESVAICARMLTEAEDFNSNSGSAYLWKAHADSLTYLLACATKVQEQGVELLQLSKQRGLTEKASSLETTLERLRTQEMNVARALETLEAQPK